MAPVRLVVVGLGWIGRKHATLVHGYTDCSLVGLCDVDDQRRSFADELSVPFYRDPSELLAREKPQGAIIATPNGQHARVVEVCPSHGVHVLIERPIADTLRDAERAVNVAAENGIRVLVGHHRRHSPFLQKARSITNGDSLARSAGGGFYDVGPF